MAKTWQIILATVVIFLAGLVAGGATALGAARWMVRHHRANPGAPTGPFGLRTPSLQPMAIGPQIMRSFEDQLDLTRDQRARIGAIVQRTAWQLGRQRREVQLTSALAMEKMQDDVETLLDPGQRLKFEELVRQQRQRLQEVKMRARQAAEQDDRIRPSCR